MPQPRTPDQAVSASCAEYIRPYRIHKMQNTSPPAGRAYSMWTALGDPISGTFSAIGAGGRLLTASTSGALAYVSASGGRTNYFVGLELWPRTASTAGLFKVIDRICDITIPHSGAALSNISGMDATSRLASGQGALIFAEVATSLTNNGATAPQSFSYTNSDGVSGRITPSFTPDASVTNIGDNALNRKTFWVPLQEGDIGVRSIQAWGCGTITGAPTGSISFSLCTEFADLTIQPNAISGIMYQVCQGPTIPDHPIVRPNTCFSVIAMTPVAASTEGICGFLYLTES